MKQTICRCASALIVIFWMLAELGRTKSYFAAFGLASWFYMVWWLGLNSAHGIKENT